MILLQQLILTFRNICCSWRYWQL